MLPVLAAALGFVEAVRRERWALPFVIWAVAHTLVYQILGVAPYYWYYAPLVPAFALLLGLGVWVAANGLSQRLRVGRSGRLGVFAIVTILTLSPLLISLIAMQQALTGPLPDPSTALSKVLPEAKSDSYRQTGIWLAENTPADASVGVTEVGVMGYVSQRPMVDFLGLIQPDAAAALGRGDPMWTLYTHQPDYLALIAANPLYNVDPRDDAWFQAAYKPIHRIDDPRFWGSPVTIYQRQIAPSSLPPAESVASPPLARFGDSIDLMAVEPQTALLSPGQALPLQLTWRADKPIARRTCESACSCWASTIVSSLSAMASPASAPTPPPAGSLARSYPTWRWSASPPRPAHPTEACSTSSSTTRPAASDCR